MTKTISRGVAKIRHSTTGRVFEIDGDSLDWEQVGSEERAMGPEHHYQAVVDHPELGQLTWSLWEYPVGVENMSETGVNGHILVENITYGLQHPPDEEDGA